MLREDNVTEMDGLGATLAHSALKAIAFVCDILTFPIYVLLQRPWKVCELSRRIKATPINKDDRTIVYRSVDKASKTHIEMVRCNVTTMASMFEFVARKHANKKCLGTRRIQAEEDEIQPNGRVFKKYNMGEYMWKTYAEVNELATNFGKGIRELGNLPRENIVIFAETRAEWMIAAHGLFKQNIPVVTLYATLGDEAIAHGINETEVTTVITSYDLMPKFKSILKHTPLVKTLIYMEDQLKELNSNEYDRDVKILKFTDVLARGAACKIPNSLPSPSDTAIIMYTSGSTGVPKGVILLHSNLIATMKAFVDSTEIFDDDILIGFLPLAHVFELLVESVCLVSGIAIGYSSALTMIDTSSKIKKGTKGDASVLHPTCMTSVPLILDRISKGIQEKVSKGTMLQKILFNFAYEYKVNWVRRGYSTPLIDKVIFGKVRNMLGGKVRLILTGGAPLSPDTHEQTSICLCASVIQGYGLTETTSCATVMDAHDRTVGRVGAVTTVCDIMLVNWEEGNYRITDKPYPRGEIIIGGENVSPGYHKLPGKTKDDFFDEDGKRWFKSGDICEIQEDGVVKIIDRKKDLVKLQAGEYVSLGKVEAELKTCPFVDNICVYGDSSKQYCVALVVPHQQMIMELVAKRGIPMSSFEELCSSRDAEKIVLQELADHGKKCKLEKFEIPAAVKLCKEVWSPDMGLVTAAFKLKRKDIQERYQHEINRMYAS
ncbi:AMP-binding protein [Oryctes borbonicus]|uniref:long-chain-fatty-acid--CoA ligase n=1 Tax=Oryctes borbonicus TaxID=1629725 RepID=A0A0T6AUV5_9SCAR|nr:AMP-binding protein [Oryctes borbonicus]